jgi:hypothetical protein
MSKKTLLLGNQIVAIVERKGNTVDITFTDNVKVDNITAVIENGKLREDYEIDLDDEDDGGYDGDGGVQG